MKVRLVKRQTVTDFVSIHSRSKVSFDIWLRLLNSADWNVLEDIKFTFRTVDFIGNGTDRIIFNVGGNKYRVICSYFFGLKNVHLFINWIGTHNEYNEICKQNLQYTIENY